MLSIYPAIEKVCVLRGGTTRPWKILALVNGKPEPFAVKLFDSKGIEEGQYASREVYGNVLATALDLPTPKPALIDFTDTFIQTLSCDDKKLLLGKDNRLKFGCKFIEGSVAFSPNSPKYAFERYEYENIYAFDQLIYNVDRYVGKPNILLADNHYYLIDHELTLPINYLTLKNFRSQQTLFNFKAHIFYKLLRRGRKESKNHFFETFEENLRFFNPTIVLDQYRNQMINVGHPIGNYEIIIEYLNLVKQDSNKFIEILRRQII